MAVIRTRNAAYGNKFGPRENKFMAVKSKLRANERCPIHRSKFCCGRALKVKAVKELKFRQLNDGTKIFPDGREIYPPSKLKRIKDKMLSYDPTCKACGIEFTEYSEVELAHKESKGSGAFKRDDREINLYLMCKSGNRRQGSMSLESYLELCKSKGIHPCQE